MAREQDYDAFVAARPAYQQIVEKVREQRDSVDKMLTWARLKYLYVDYQPFSILRNLFTKNKAGDVVVDEATKTRYGWVRWQEIRARIDRIDAWIEAPSQASGLSTLREIMVEIPKSIEFELEAWDRNRVLVIDKAKEVGKDALEAAGSAASSIAIPIALAFAAATAYDWQKRRK